MRAKQLCWSLILLALPALAATFGTVVARPEGFADLVLDESRRRLYLVNTTMSQIDVYNTATNPPSRGTPIRVGAQPISLAMSRDSRLLYVTCYYDSVLDVIDLDRSTVVQRVPLAAKPEGVAVGADGRVVIGTIGTGTGQASLIIFDPSASSTNNLTSVVITPPATPAPLLPPPSGRTFLSANGRLMATRDGRRIVGVNNASNNRTRTVFVYDTASGTVLLSRSVPNASTVLSISPDGRKFMAGPTLFDMNTLSVLAQQNTANSPFVFPTGTASNFNLQQNQGGSVFSPDGANLYSAFNVAPVQTPPARANVSRLLLNDPDNLLIRFGLQLTENLAGKMVITSDGGTIYALSESGFMVLPIGRAFDSPIAIPETNVLLLVNDQCGVNAEQKKAQIEVRDVGGGARMTVTASLLQLPTSGPVGLGGAGGAGGGGTAGNIVILVPPVVPGADGRAANVPASMGNVGNTQAAVIQTSPQLKVDQLRNSATITFNFNSLAARALGTVAPHDFLLQSAEAINIPPVVRVYQNNRNSEAKGTIIPVSIGISNSEGLVDMVTDTGRQRLYIANSGQNRVEVFDMRQQKFLSPVKVGQLPRSLALDGDGQTLYVANSGGESISIVDLTKLQETGRIAFPPIPFNASYSLVTPSVIAYSVRGLQVMMSDGSLWKVVGNQAIPRMIVNHPVLGNMRTLPGPHRTIAATPEGNYVLFLAGNGMGYLYDARVDDFVRGTQVVSTPIQGYFGPIGAGPNGSYYLVNGALLNSSLTTIATAPQYTYNPGSSTPVSSDPSVGPLPGLPSGNLPSRGGPVTLSRPVAAVAAAGARSFVRFSGPIRTSQNQLAADAGVVELVDATNGRTIASVNALETPLAAQVGNQRVNTNGRTIAVDAAGTTAYVLTTSGLSILPLETVAARDLPAVNRNGVVSTASYLTSVATGGLISIFGRNLGTAESATMPYPTLLGGVCVTLSNTPLPLILTSPTQINAQLPPNMNAGNYQMVIRSIDKQVGSTATAVRVSKYAPAVFVNDGVAAIFHPDGSPVTPDHPAHRDEKLVIYATGLGPTKGGRVTAGAPAPSNPLAVTEKVQVFFGNPGYREAEQIVEWSGLTPGYVGLYQINIRVPGAHIKGKALPVQIRIGGVNSPSTGPAVPVVAVE
ncbi:MAG: hypothetical protein ACE15B_06635 [Bryobacteraceae bacterium]